MTKNIIAESSHGTLTFNRKGNVVEFERYDENDHESHFLSTISRVDVQELANYLEPIGLTLDDLCGGIDILDIAYWFRTDSGEEYEPVTDHRKVSFEEMNPEEAGLL
jgi:hypothetical protein